MPPLVPKEAFLFKSMKKTIPRVLGSNNTYECVKLAASAYFGKACTLKLVNIDPR